MLMYMATIAKLSKKFQWLAYTIITLEKRQLQQDSLTGPRSMRQYMRRASQTKHYAMRAGVEFASPWTTQKTLVPSAHSAQSKPLASHYSKRRPVMSAPPPKPTGNTSAAFPCRDWNRLENYMDCKSCRFLHVCAKCRQSDHAAPKCIY